MARRSISAGRWARMTSPSGTASTPGTVDGNRWTELFRSLPPPARLAAVGALVIPGSMLFPWYGIQFGPGLSQTGFDSFSIGQLALLLTVAAALYLIFRCASGYELPRPLHEGSLLGAAGAWSAVLVGYLMLDRPDEISG